MAKQYSRRFFIRKPLSINFFTIVLNGEPFIRYHIDSFSQLPFKWHWHIVEGVADLTHDTNCWAQNGGRVSDELHMNGLSNDGTTEYLNDLVQKYPNHITIYRKPLGRFWDGKLEMVNAPLANIMEECILWQIDSDELWSIDQICKAYLMFSERLDKTAAFYLCHFFVGEDLVVTSRDTYGNHTSYEWLRTWRFTPGCRWLSHAPPKLAKLTFTGRLIDLASINPFLHKETAKRGLVFQHYAYVTEKQLRFKEIYYGYNGAVTQWQTLQRCKHFPLFLKNYFAWVQDDACVDTIISQGIKPIAKRNSDGNWRSHEVQTYSYSTP